MHAWIDPSDPDRQPPEPETPETPDSPGTPGMPDRRTPIGDDPDAQRAPGAGEDDASRPPPMQASGQDQGG